MYLTLKGCQTMGKRKKRGNKSHTIKHHFKKRMLSRFGLEITDDDIDDIVTMIQSGKSDIIEKQSRTKTLHQIKYKDMTINIVYDRERKLPVTALFEDNLYNDMMYGTSSLKDINTEIKNKK